MPYQRSYSRLTQPNLMAPRVPQEQSGRHTVPLPPPELLTPEQKEVKDAILEIQAYLPKKHFKYNFLKSEIERTLVLVGTFNPGVLKQHFKSVLQKNGFLYKESPREDSWKRRFRELTEGW